MREIVLDTETTGLEANNGDRIFEVGCVELVNQMPTGQSLHKLVDPQRPLSQKSVEITGFTDDQLRGKPLFADIVEEFLHFIGSDRLVIHNAAFDIGFLNMELGRLGKSPLAPNRVVDTLAMAKKRFPGAQVNLDALCRRFDIDNSNREKHGALLDSELLAEVYLELSGGRQPALVLAPDRRAQEHLAEGEASQSAAERPKRRPRLTEKERSAHQAFVDELGGDALWRAIHRST